jgi:hypothetical protein
MLRDMPGLPGVKMRYAIISALALVASLADPRIAGALEIPDEPLSIAGAQTATPDESAGESVGEPSAEDAPVEGEPGAGEAPDLPPDEPTDAGSQPITPSAPSDAAPKQ